MRYPPPRPLASQNHHRFARNQEIFHVKNVITNTNPQNEYMGHKNEYINHKHDYMAPRTSFLNSKSDYNNMNQRIDYDNMNQQNYYNNMNQRNDFMNQNQNLESESHEFGINEENLSQGAEVKSLEMIIEDVNNEMSDIKIKLNEDYRRLTSMDQMNEEKAKRFMQQARQALSYTMKTIDETREEIESRVGYVQQLLFKKRDESDSSTHVMSCVSDSLNRLGQITPELMAEEEHCIQSELTMSRSVAKVTHDLIKEYLHKVKVQQERLNKCNSMKSRKLCLVNMYNGLVDFKTNLKSSVAMKMSETVNFLDVLSSRMRSCSMAQVGKVVTRAGDVIVKFNACVQGIEIPEETDKGLHDKSEMLLFVV